jgi:hypothetical protein
MTGFATKADSRFRKVTDKIAKTDLATTLADEIDAKAEASDLNTVSGKVDTLVDVDTGKSARTISAEEVAKVIAGAPTSFDTLKEIADWIQNDTTGAAKMANDIAALQAKVVLGIDPTTTAEYATVRAYVEAYVASQIDDAELDGSDTIDITNGVISVIVNTGNGLSVGSNGVELALASTTAAGAMSAADKTKLDDADVTPYTGAGAVSVIGHEISVAAASTTAAGTMSAADKAKLDGADVTAYTGTGAVSVLNHEISVAAATQSAAGTMSAADKTKLDGLETATDAEVQAILDSIWPTA